VKDKGPYLQRAEEFVEMNDTLDNLLQKEATEISPQDGVSEPTTPCHVLSITHYTHSKGPASEWSVSRLKAPKRISRYRWPRDTKQDQANGTTVQEGHQHPLKA